MSMSTRVVGHRDLDGTFARMAAVKVACEEAGIDYPPSLHAYFKPLSPGESLSELTASKREIDIAQAVSRPKEEMADIWLVDLSKLPAEVKAVVFRNSY